MFYHWVVRFFKFHYCTVVMNIVVYNKALFFIDFQVPKSVTEFCQQTKLCSVIE